jgi:hypothetical protein
MRLLKKAHRPWEPNLSAFLSTNRNQLLHKYVSIRIASKKLYTLLYLEDHIKQSKSDKAHMQEIKKQKHFYLLNLKKLLRLAYFRFSLFEF